MGTKWEQSGKKNPEVGQESEQSGNKVGRRTPKWENGNKVATKWEQSEKNNPKVGQEWQQSGNKVGTKWGQEPKSGTRIGTVGRRIPKSEEWE